MPFLRPVLNAIDIKLSFLTISFPGSHVTHPTWALNRNNSYIRHVPVSVSGYLLAKGWLRGSAVERQSLASVLSPSCARPVADG